MRGSHREIHLFSLKTTYADVHRQFHETGIKANIVLYIGQLFTFRMKYKCIYCI